MKVVKYGDDLWAVHNDEVIAFHVDSIRGSKAYCHSGGGIIEKAYNELYAHRTEAEAHLKATQMIIICREICKNTGEVMVYKLQGTAADVSYMALHIRSQYNPELVYYYTLNREQEELEDLIAMMMEIETCSELEKAKIIVRA